MNDFDYLVFIVAQWYEIPVYRLLSYPMPLFEEMVENMVVQLKQEAISD